MTKERAQGPLAATEDIKQTAVLALQVLGIHEYLYWLWKDG